MSDWKSIDSGELDRYITGNYGEDYFLEPDDEDGYEEQAPHVPGPVTREIEAFIAQNGGNAYDALNVALARLQLLRANYDELVAQLAGIDAEAREDDGLFVLVETSVGTCDACGYDTDLYQASAGQVEQCCNCERLQRRRVGGRWSGLIDMLGGELEAMVDEVQQDLRDMEGAE